jgi:hypothetical protein
LFIDNPPWLYSLVDQVFYGRVQRIELSPTISIKNSPANKPETPFLIELVPIACQQILEESCISDKDDSKNNEMDSGHKTPLEAE